MHRLRTYLMLAAVLALLVPATAAAQNPGDAQYDDPLAPNQPQDDGGGGGGDSGTESGSAADRSPEAGGRAGSSDRLPRTGIPVAVMALLGGGMVAAGAALRRRLN